MSVREHLQMREQDLLVALDEVEVLEREAFNAGRRDLSRAYVAAQLYLLDQLTAVHDFQRVIGWEEKV